MNILILCSLGLAAAVAVLWAIERNRATPKPSSPAGPEALDLADPARAATEAEGCLCNQCEEAPGCARTYPDCLRNSADDPGPAA